MEINNKIKKYSFIGAGNMASAIIRSFISNKVVNPESIIVYDIDKSKYNFFKSIKVNCANSVDEAISFSDYIILAVKPQFMIEALFPVKKCIEYGNKIYISIAAGITTNFINNFLECNCPVIRTMPNTPFLVGMGAIAISKNKFVDRRIFETIIDDFKKVATVAIFDESKMNSVVSVNGSSPAYIFKFIRAMIDGAVQQGFSESEVKELVLKSIEGSIELVRQNNVPIQNLIDMVTSKKGTTEKAIISLDNDDFENSIIRAMFACTKRAEELAENK
ncbi:MAG: pyrroline-5-carboxylate reductase [Clostridiales bacterium GWF2_38_85]|nr:MAG: pyrroline-5-carboxylate reductase [Clostridiales bacterium GWF2_38_85]